VADALKEHGAKEQTSLGTYVTHLITENSSAYVRILDFGIYLFNLQGAAAAGVDVVQVWSQYQSNVLTHAAKMGLVVDLMRT
jgi:hypothetical protein